MKKCVKYHKQGSVLMTVLGLFALFIILFMALSTMALRTTKDTIADVERQQAFLHAKSVLQALVDEIVEEPTLLDNLSLPFNAQATVTSDAGNQNVLLHFANVGSNSNKIIITATGYFNDKTGSLSATFERSSGSGGNGGGNGGGGNGDEWITEEANHDLFRYALAHRDTSGWEGAPNIKNFMIAGDVYFNYQVKLSHNFYVKGDFVVNYLETFPNADGKKIRVDGNVFVKKTVWNRKLNFFINGSLRIKNEDNAGVAIEGLVLMKDLIVNKTYGFESINNVIGGSVYLLNNNSSWQLMENSVVYQDVYASNGASNNSLDSRGTVLVGGRINFTPRSFANVIIHQTQLKPIQNYEQMLNLGGKQNLCVGPCSTTLITPSTSSAPTNLPEFPPNAKTSGSFPSPLTSDAFQCESISNHAYCELREVIQTNGLPVYINADMEVANNPWHRHYDIDSSMITGGGNVYFVFNQTYEYYFDNKIGYIGNEIDHSRKLFFLMGSNVNNHVFINNDFNGFIYTQQAKLNLKSYDYTGAINSHQVLMCVSDCPAIPPDEHRVINYIDPLSTNESFFAFTGYE